MEEKEILKWAKEAASQFELAGKISVLMAAGILTTPFWWKEKRTVFCSG